MDKLNVLFYGAGAIGTYIGGSLALAGHKVAYLEQPSIAHELRTVGLKLDLSLDERRGEENIFYIGVPTVQFEPSLEDALKHTKFDVIIFALKSFDTESALEEMKPFAAQMPPILSLQNGVDNESILAAALGADKVIYGTVTSAIGRNSAGSVVLEKLRGMGVAAGHPLSEQLVKALNDAMLNAKLYPNAADMKWSKMLTNLVANASSAILDMTAKEIFSHSGLYDMEIRMLKEALAVMKAQGIHTVNLPGTPVKQLVLATKLPKFLTQGLMIQSIGEGRGAKMPSFHIDLHIGRGKSEVGYLNGAVVRAGEKLGIPTPINKALTEILLELTHGTLIRDMYSRDPEKLLVKMSLWDTM